MQQGFFQRQGIGFKLAAIPLIFIVAIAVILSYVVMAQNERRQDADRIDSAGRQRSLNQWYVKDLLQASLKQENDYAYWRDVFLNTQESLLRGGPVLKTLMKEDRFTVAAAPTEAIRSSLQEQRRLMEAMIKLEPRLLALDPQSSAFTPVLKELMGLSNDLHLESRQTVSLYTGHTRAKVDEMLRNMLLLGFGVTILGLLLNWLIARGISGPVIRLANRALEVANGTLSGEALSVSSQDEVGQLTQAFNQMTQNLLEFTEQNNEGVRELNTATAEILASTQQQTASTQEQVTALQQTTATMEEIRQSGAQISERAQEVSAEAEASSEISHLGLQSVQLTVSNMRGIGQQVNEVAENIVNLSEKNRAVGDIIALVTEIAEQSNLLALNAAIEAAAAGEQGRSFSVVANEMKHLADQAKDATTQVRGILEDIQKGISRTVMLTEEAVKKVDGGRQQTDLAESTIHKMANTTQQSIQAFQQIVAATNQQQLGLEQVFLALQDIRQTTEQMAVSTTQLSKACGGLNTMTKRQEKLVSRYRV